MGNRLILLSFQSTVKMYSNKAYSRVNDQLLLSLGMLYNLVLFNIILACLFLYPMCEKVHTDGQSKWKILCGNKSCMKFHSE